MFGYAIHLRSVYRFNAECRLIHDFSPAGTQTEEGAKKVKRGQPFNIAFRVFFRRVCAGAHPCEPFWSHTGSDPEKTPLAEGEEKGPLFKIAPFSRKVAGSQQKGASTTSGTRFRTAPRTDPKCCNATQRRPGASPVTMRALRTLNSWLSSNYQYEMADSFVGNSV
jgi:hypothetical protein